MNDDERRVRGGSLESQLQGEEKLGEAWVAQQDGSTRMWVAKRGEFEELHQLRAKLNRYEEREPLVLRLLNLADPAYDDGKFQVLRDCARAVRDFKVTP